MGSSTYGDIKFIFSNKFILSFSRFFPFIMISPDVGFTRPKIIAIVVVLPHPLGPRRPIILPLLITKLKSLTAIVLS